MEQNVAHLGFIQHNIHRYSWHSIVTKGLSVVLLGFVFLTLAQLVGEQKTSVITAIGAAVAFFLWLLDGHFTDMQERYASLYQDAASSQTADWTMKLSLPTSLSVKALWKPILLAFHLSIMAAMIILMMLSN